MKSMIAMPKLALLGVLMVFFTIAPATADSGAWTLVESKGSVQVTFQGIRPVALTTGDEVAPGQRVTTDGDGRAVLRNGKNTIVVSPNSALEIPAVADPSMMTRVRQLVGTLLFDVEKRKEQHFEVLTPDVAVVVKGTTFTTTVGSQGAVVHVISGLVQVADIRSGQTVFIRPGQTASSPTGGGNLTVRGKAASAPAAGQPAPQDQGAQSDTAPGKQANGPANGKGVKIGAKISGQNVTLAQLSNGLLRQDGAPGRSVGRGNGSDNGNGINAAFSPSDSLGTGALNPGGNVPQGVAVGLTGTTPPGLSGATPPGLVGNTNAFGGNPNAGGGSSNAHGGNPNAGGGNPNAGGANAQN